MGSSSGGRPLRVWDGFPEWHGPGVVCVGKRRLRLSQAPAYARPWMRRVRAGGASAGGAVAYARGAPDGHGDMPRPEPRDAVDLDLERTRAAARPLRLGPTPGANRHRQFVIVLRTQPHSDASAGSSATAGTCSASPRSLPDGSRRQHRSGATRRQVDGRAAHPVDHKCGRGGLMRWTGMKRQTYRCHCQRAAVVRPRRTVRGGGAGSSGNGECEGERAQHGYDGHDGG